MSGSFTSISFSPSSALDEERRPKVVGAAWLKDCRDTATYLGEEPYLVNLEEHRMYNLGTRRTNRSRVGAFDYDRNLPVCTHMNYSVGALLVISL